MPFARHLHTDARRRAWRAMASAIGGRTDAVRLTPDQRTRILDAFETHARREVTHASTWSRRRYAPMHIREPWMASVRRAIAHRLPEYAVVFDVVFESRGGEVGYHVDWESLGPFRIDDDAWAAVRDEHFVSVHFNLTRGGGALTTVPGWPRLSWLHQRAIAAVDIFAWPHRLVTWLSWPILAWAGVARSAARDLGNVFCNVHLHAVSAGAPRVSYVVRLVRRGCVYTDRATLRAAATRSRAVADAFADVEARCPDDGGAVLAERVWIEAHGDGAPQQATE